MPEENINQKFRSKKIDEMKNYLIEEINQNKSMSKKHKKVCGVLNYIYHSLVAFPIGITSSTIGLKICVITARIKKYKSINKKKKKTMIKQCC